MEPRNFRFHKIEKRWYIDFPEWEGEQWELEMVCGADDMLDIIAGHPSHKEVFLTMCDESFVLIDTEPIPTQAFPLTKIEDTPDIGGAKYFLKEWHGVDYNLEVWLCYVTEYVFGKLPKTIYIA